MSPSRRALGLVFFAGIQLAAEAAGAQSYDLSWYTVDGGGATFSTSGAYSLGATIGQPDASGPLGGGSYSLVGGFWNAGSGVSPEADLSISKTDGQATASPGQPVTYTIVVGNAGPSGVTGATVVDPLPASLTAATWTCAGSGGGACTASGSGSIVDAVNLPAGRSVTYVLTGTLSLAASGTVANTATVAPPAGTTDPVSTNDAATDTDTVVPFAACGVTDTGLVADGRTMPDAIAAGATRWFSATLAIGRSYSVEVRNTDGTGSAPGILTIFGGDDGCSGTHTQAVTDTTATEPGANAATTRVSFVAAGAQTLFRARLVNGQASALPLSLRWSETTIYSPAWSDNGTYDTYYNLQNTSGATLHVTLTLVDTTGVAVTTSNLTIPPGADVSVNTLGLGTPRNKTGTTRVAHDGPPGALVIGGAIANFTTVPAYVQALKFRALRESR